MTNTLQQSHLGGSPDSRPEPIQGNLGATILGPHNVPLELENPDLLTSPQTDHGTVPNLKSPSPPRGIASLPAAGHAR
jgi:hypothetical protein